MLQPIPLETSTESTSTARPIKAGRIRGGQVAVTAALQILTGYLLPRGKPDKSKAF